MYRELRHVKKWLEANKLGLNIQKTNFVVFHSPAKILTEPIERNKLKDFSLAKRTTLGPMSLCTPSPGITWYVPNMDLRSLIKLSYCTVCLLP